MKQELINKYHTKFPWTFFKFWEWIKSICPSNETPLDALKCFNIRLVGPFEYLNGDLHQLSDDQILIHYRYYFDLPEFQTIMIENESAEQIHYGFWRDDPDFNPVGICKANGGTKVMDKSCKMVHPIASNLFYFVQAMIEVSSKNKKDENKEKIDFIQVSMDEFVRKNKIKLPAKKKCVAFKEREKRVVAKTFSGFGLVVPVKDDVGYRPIGYSERELKRILKRMNADKQKQKKVDASEMEIILTNICLADDEGDPGMGYELGIDFFFSYPMFEKHAKRLLMNAYNLTNREAFKKILSAHVNVRAKQIGHYEYNQLMHGKAKNEKSDKMKGKTEKQRITNFFAKRKVVRKTLDELSSDSD